LVKVTRNGIDVERFRGSAEKVGNRLIYSSSGNRGLSTALDFLIQVQAEVPDAELHIYYGFETWEKMAKAAGSQSDLGHIAQLQDKISGTRGAFMHGRVGQKELADAYLSSKVWFYPTMFTETSCISAMEAQAAGCVPVTTKLAALVETVKHGVLLDPPVSAEGYRRAFVSKVVSLLRDERVRGEIAWAGRTWAMESLSWESVAKEWVVMFREGIAAKRIQPLSPYGREPAR
jgi:glycosyltransferase involved in cell wall biosynthesis